LSRGCPHLPINVQHALLFTLVIVTIIAVLTATTYVIITNMITDAYRYEGAVVRANEKLRIAAALGSSGLVYGMRNIGLSEVVVKEAGVIYPTGTKVAYVRDLSLKPGEIYVGREYGIGSFITFYVITSRGNVFTTDIADFTQTYTQDIYVRNLIPSTYVFSSPLKYGEGYEYSASMSSYGYVFAFLVVDDPYSDESLYLQIGPVNVADLYNGWKIPYYSEPVSQTSSRLRASMSLILKISNDPNEGRYPHYRLDVPISVSRLDGRNGLLIYACFGFIWRTMTNNVFGYQLVNPLRVVEYTPGSSKDYFAESRYEANLIPSSLDINSLVATLGKQGPNFNVEAPSGSQAYILLMKCFKIEDKGLGSFTTTESKPWDVVRGLKIYTYIAFPGKTHTSNGITDVDYIYLRLVFNPEVYVLTALGSI